METCLKSRIIVDTELRRIIAGNQIQGVLNLLDGKLTQSLCIDSHGNETEKITIKYPKTTE